MIDSSVIFSSPTTPENSQELLAAMTEGEFVFVGGMLFRLAEERYDRVENVSVTKTDGESLYDINISMSDEKYDTEHLQALINDEEVYQSCLITDILEEMKRVKSEEGEGNE